MNILGDWEQWISMDPGTQPTISMKEDRDKLERKDMSTIPFLLSCLVLLNVFGENNEFKLWNKLESLY